MNEPSPEKITKYGEKEPVVELGIREPDAESRKGFMITFHCSTQEECVAYNHAVSSVMRRENLNPFHQLGVDAEPGLHWWEALFVESVTREQLESLIPEMKEKIEKRLKEL